VANRYIEYFGLMGDPDYERKVEQKIKYAAEIGAKIVPLYADDLVSAERLHEKFAFAGLRKTVISARP
jgi:hypothetical protein